MSRPEPLAELKDQLDARTRLLHDVAHELKNPMAVIHGYAAFLSQEEVTDAEKRRALSAIVANAERVIAIVDQLQEAARVESCTLRVEPRDCDAGALLSAAAESAELEASRHGLELRWSSSVSDALGVRADPVRAGQILANLVSNALKFTPSGGVVELHAQREHGFVRFTVADTGPGIPADDLPHIFQRFYQAGGEEQKRRGLGLGLAICRTLVEAQGGRIWAENGSGQGARFHFTLPASAR